MYCTNCGKEIKNETKFCPNCGYNTNPANNSGQASGTYAYASQNNGVNVQSCLNQLSEKLKINGIIWIVIAALQILGGLYVNWVLLIIGVLNLVSAIKDINYSKQILTAPDNIIDRFEPLVGPIITLVYNIIFGGIIGVVGSIYYFVAIRGFVLQNRAVFEQVGNK